MLHARNYPVLGITAGAVLLLAIALYVPSLRDIFQFSRLHVNDVAICVVLAMASVTGIEVMKLRHRSAT
jgi:hypothetical protein